MKQVTIVIPNYNGIKYISDCLLAVYAQENAPAFEVLVVDNGSTDGSPQVIAQQFPQTTVIALPENTGFCHAVNVGIEASAAPYVILLNNDTKVDAHFVEALYRAIEQDNDCFSVSAQMLMWDEPRLLDGAGDRYCVLGWAYARGKGKPAQQYDKRLPVFSACGGAAIYRKKIFDEIGLFDEQHFAYLEDLDVGYRARIFGYHNLYEPDAKVIHYGSAASGSRYNSWKTRLAAANSVYVGWKNMPLLQYLINFPFLFLGYLIKFLFFCKKGMGKEYLEGIKAGIKKCASEVGRKQKVRFKSAHFKHYLLIQLQLYAGVFQIIKKN